MCVCVCMYVCIYTFRGVAHEIMATIIGNEYGNLSSNFGHGCLHFPYI